MDPQFSSPRMKISRQLSLRCPLQPEYL